MDPIYVSTMAQYLAQLEEIGDQWGRVWYRGVRNAEFKPVPGLIWRKLTDEDVEASLVHHFLVHYKAVSGSLTCEQWELYALMQHHGLPTRLLDWTRSPLMAMYFALEKYSSSKNEAGVWVMDPRQLNQLSVGEDEVYCPSELRSKALSLGKEKTLNLDAYLPGALDPSDADEYPKHPLAIETPLSSPRIRAQQGCFTIHGSSHTPLDELFLGGKFKTPHFRLIKIPDLDARDRLVKSLYGMGITEDVVYQDLDSLSRRILREVT